MCHMLWTAEPLVAVHTKEQVNGSMSVCYVYEVGERGGLTMEVHMNGEKITKERL